MKTPKRCAVRGVRFVISLFVSVSCIAVLGSGIARAEPLPLAYTAVFSAPNYPLSGYAVYGPQNVAWDITDNYGSVSTGNLIANFGAFDINSYASTPANPIEGWGSGGSGEAVFFFSVVPKNGTPPGGPLVQVPVSITTAGQGSVEEGDGAFSVSTWESVTGYLGAASSPGNGESLFPAPYTQAFDVTRPIWVYPGTPIEVAIYAGEAAYSPCGPCTSEASAYVYVDPTLDQAAFDAEPGNSGITLSDYYQIDYSPNMSVPEPSTLTLLGMGLALVGYGGRRRKARA